MAFELEFFNDAGLEASFVEWLVDERSIDIRNHFGKLWDYYQNPIQRAVNAGIDTEASESARMYVQAQEWGLPSRITGMTHLAEGDVFSGKASEDVQRKEVVIENDIGWRVNALVDFLFGKEIQIVSKASEAGKRAEIESILKAVFESNGAIGFYQDMAVLGSVYGFVDCLIRASDPILSHVSNPPFTLQLETVCDLAAGISLELIEAPRALPILAEYDYKHVNYYVQHFYQLKNTINREGGFLSRFNNSQAGERDVVAITEIIGPDGWQRYENKELVGEGQLPWGFLPLVHIQNIAMPYYYEGASDVEPLVALQDELNTRLSDRASRITLQSFKMYLAKGIEGVEDRPVSPGRMWCTSNTDATIETFGGDAASPSEDLHIMEIREALDKASGVTPIVAGVLKSKLGNLSSAVALRLAMIGTLSKTDRKRFTYGEGIKRISKMVLMMLDKAGIYHTTAEERNIDILFPSPLPENTLEKLQEAQIKLELGVKQQQVLRELGYETTI